MPKKEIEEMLDAAQEPQAEDAPPAAPALNTGATLLNLAYTGRYDAGLLPGKYYFVVGDSASGKTVWTQVIFAEACIDKAFAGHELIYDNPEDGMLMNTDHLFGEAVTERVRPPAYHKGGGHKFSETLEDFYYHLDDATKRAEQGGHPFIYILDSMDALTTAADDDKFDRQKKASRSAREDKVAGSYGTAKARQNSDNLRRAMKGLRRTGSILVVISQTRDNINSTWGGKTRSGGRALRFYATVEAWTSVAGRIKKTVMGKEREVGTRVAFKTTKNRITGRLYEVELEIYPNLGIDDLGACVDYLVEEGQWGKRDNTLTGTLVGDGTRDKVIKLIERRGLEGKVRELCGKVWREVEAAMALRRKNRYTGV